MSYRYDEKPSVSAEELSKIVDEMDLEENTPKIKSAFPEGVTLATLYGQMMDKANLNTSNGANATLKDAMEMFNEECSFANKLALAISLFPAALMFVMVIEMWWIRWAEALAILGFFGCLAAGIGLCIAAPLTRKKHRLANILRLNDDDTMQFEQFGDDVRRKMILKLIAGICCTIFSFGPAVAADMIGLYELSFILFFAMIAVGLYLIINSALTMGGIRKLLDLNKRNRRR